MSRTTLCVATASVLAIASLGVMIGRYRVLGDQIKVPIEPGTWKVVMFVSGQNTGYDGKLITCVPLDLGHQHVLREEWRSNEMLAKPPDARHPQRHQVLWTQRPGISAGAFRASYHFYCSVEGRRSGATLSGLARSVYAAPRPGDDLHAESRIECDNPDISALARRVTEGLADERDQLDALYRFVEQDTASEPRMIGPGVSALECYRAGSGDALAKSRLLVALCRNRNIPARLVNGLALRHGREQHLHTWVETWVHGRWVPACPVYHHLGRVPATYLVFNYGDVPLVRGRGMRDLNYAFLVEKPEIQEPESASDGSLMRRLFLRFSLTALPPAEQRLVEFLLLLPVAALIVCIYRNLIGLGSFGTFAPALVGLAFRDLGGLPGILVFVAIVLVGWMMRRVLDRYHLLQVPRQAFLLSMVVVVLIVAIVGANQQQLPATKYVSLFPIVILTGMIERFWTVEVEEGTTSSFRILLSTLVIAASISLFLGLHAVVKFLFRYPETLGLIMAAQLLLGRYTGYRLTELLRFRDLVPKVDVTLRLTNSPSRGA